MWLFAVLIVLALGAVAVVAAGKGEPLAPTYPDRPDAAVPAHHPAGTDLGGDDLRRVRFSLGLRGYRMSEVDDLLSRLAGQLDAARADPTRANSPCADPTRANSPRAEPISGAPTED